MQKTQWKQRSLMIGGLALVALFVALGIMSSTLARYTRDESTQAQARVAAFDVALGDGSGEFGLFDTIYDSDGGQEDDVLKAGAGEIAIIAPGTSGNFDLAVVNNSEVNVAYSLDFTLTNAGGIPIEFSSDNAAWTAGGSFDVTDVSLAMGDEDTVTIYWRWAYQDVGDAGRDADDTLLGEAAAISDVPVTVVVNASFTQVD